MTKQSRSRRGARSAAMHGGEQALVLRHDRRPGVVPLVVRAAGEAERVRLPPVVEQPAQRLRELLVGGIVETAVRALYLAAQHRALRIDERGPPHLPGLEERHGEALEAARMDEQA